MKNHRRRAAAALTASLLAGLVWTMTAFAATTYSDYAVYGDHGVFIGGNSEVVGLVGARHNNSPTVYPGQPPEALGMNGGATITGDARIDGNVNMANSTLISGTLYRSGTRNVNPNATVNNEVVGDPELPAATLLSQSVWPSGLGTGCPAGPSPFQTSFAANSVSIALTPDSYGEVKAGSNSNLTFNGSGDYYLQRVQFGGGLTITVNGPNVRVFVCADVVLAGGVVSPAALLPNDFILEVAGIGIAAGSNAFTATGFDWIGNLLVPTRGVHFGTGSGGATWYGYMWADHVDIEHGVVNTKAPKKSGTKFNDLNGDGIKDVGEPGLPGWTVYVDYDDDGVLDANEPFGVTDANGYYEIVDIAPGTWKVREVQQAGWFCSLPATNDGKPDVAGGCYYQETFADGDNFGGNDFGNWQIRQSSSKTGFKFNDLDGDGVYEPLDGESGIGDWPIDLLNAADNSVISSTTTAGNGAYSFVIPGPGQYRVCEGSMVGGWVQTYPYLLATPPAGESITGDCPVPNQYGYEFTVAGGENLINDDFGNWVPPVVCQKETVNTVMDQVYPGNGGPDLTVRTWLLESVQDAVDTVTDVNNDGYLIVMVVAHADGSLGGAANQKVNVSRDYTLTDPTKPFGLFGCSVTLTGGGTDPSVWVKNTAKSKSIPVNGRATTIFVMDLHGAGSTAAAVQADGTNRYLRNEAASASAVGIKVNGNYNTVHNGAAASNTGDGIQVNGNYNLVTDTNSMSNAGNGASIAGSNNQILKLDVGERGTGSSLDGIHVVGNTNTLGENDVFANGGDGIDVAGYRNVLTKNVAGDRTKGNAGNGFLIAGYLNNLTENRASANGANNTFSGFNISGGTSSANANLLKNNLSNTGSSGSDLENAGKEWKFLNWIKNNGGGNKADGVVLANGVKGLANFPASGATYNYVAVQTAE